MRQCSKCKRMKHEYNFYICNDTKDGYSSQCKQCKRKMGTGYRKKNKIKLAKQSTLRSRKDRKKYIPVHYNLKINGCAICGYNKCNAALDFHHVNPKDKKFSVAIGTMGRSDNSIVKELNKCILLCSNCHREIEDKSRRYQNEKQKNKNSLSCP